MKQGISYIYFLLFAGQIVSLRKYIPVDFLQVGKTDLDEADHNYLN